MGDLKKLEEDKLKYFASLKVEGLKAELKKRGAKCSGKKSALFERLVFYERNSNFVTSAPSTIEKILCGRQDAPMWTPDAASYKDLNANTSLPPVSLEAIGRWAARFNKSSEKGKKMYEGKYLALARHCDQNRSTFVKGNCHAQMRKRVMYFVDAEIDSTTGEVRNAHCECTVGSGTTAHCKHLFVLLFGVNDMKHNRRILLRNTCTQQLQTFHHPAEEYFGTPVKAQNLHYGKMSSKSSEFETFDKGSITKGRYNAKFRNLCVNFAASHPNKRKMPITTLFEPANPYAISWDHAYASESREQQLLKHLKLYSISKEEIQEIEVQTRGQHSKKLWYFIRCTHLTTSRLALLFTTVSDQALTNLARAFVKKQHVVSKALEHGIELEPEAIANYESLHGVKLKRPGILISATHPYIATSLDGVQDDMMVIEVKCPITAKNMPINHITVPYLLEDASGILRLDNSCPYYYQIQGQMMVSGLMKAKLVVYTIRDIKVIDVARNGNVINEIMCKTEEFYEHYFKPALFEKYIYRYYNDIIKCRHR